MYYTTMESFLRKCIFCDFVESWISHLMPLPPTPPDVVYLRAELLTEPG